MISFFSLIRQGALCSDDSEMPYISASDAPATVALACRGDCSPWRNCRGCTRRNVGCMLSKPYSLQVSWKQRRIPRRETHWGHPGCQGRCRLRLAVKGCWYRAAVQQPLGKIEMWLGGASVRRECFLASAWEADHSAFVLGRRDLGRGCPVGGRLRPVWAFISPR